MGIDLKKISYSVFPNLLGNHNTPLENQSRNSHTLFKSVMREVIDSLEAASLVLPISLPVPMSFQLFFSVLLESMT